MPTVEECLSSSERVLVVSQELRADCQRSILQARAQVEGTRRLVEESRNLLRLLEVSHEARSRKI